MAFSTPSRYVKNIFAQNDDEETIVSRKVLDQKEPCVQIIFSDVTNLVQCEKYGNKVNQACHYVKQSQKDIFLNQRIKRKNHFLLQIEDEIQFQQTCQKKSQIQIDRKSMVKQRQKQSKIYETAQQKDCQKYKKQIENLTNFKKQQKGIVLHFNQSSSQPQDQRETQINSFQQIQKNESKQISKLQDEKKVDDEGVLAKLNNQKKSNNQAVSCKQSNIKKLILTLDNSQQSQSEGQKIQLKQEANNTKFRNRCVLQQFSDQQLEQNQFQKTFAQKSNQQLIEIIRPITIQELVRTQQKLYLMNPIPKGFIFRTLIKRKLVNKCIAYQLFDEKTSHPIMYVKITPDGYELIEAGSCNKRQAMPKRVPETQNRAGQSQNQNPLTQRKQNVSFQIKESHNNYSNSVAYLNSNFFGTQFNCFQSNKGENKQSWQRHNRLATILYQTNLFGLRGPRKMTVYIPNQDYLIKGEKNLQEAYDIQSKNKTQTKKILKFVNKSPKWNSQIGAFVLNFNGRVTVSSVKNFIITDQNLNESCPQKANNFILFGKISTDVFNLDVKYPFSLVQGLALALSSFDKKLACQ